MHTDAFFHAVHHGQDYARAGADFAVVSDGCSSSPDTDVGARLLCLAAAAGGDIDATLARAQAAAEGLLAPTALDATLLTLRAIPEGVAVSAWGDGVVFGVRRDGRHEAWVIDHGGAPAYPIYRRQPDRWAGWIGPAQVTHWVDGEQTTHTVLVGDFPVFSDTFAARNWSLVGVASDGLLSFRGPEGPVSLLDVLAHVTDIRVRRGRFVERSSTHFLRRTAPKLGWAPTDDYSVAAVDLEEAP